MIQNYNIFDFKAGKISLQIRFLYLVWLTTNTYTLIINLDEVPINRRIFTL